jgi:hypothetical protein
MHLFATTTAGQVREFGKLAAVEEVEQPKARQVSAPGAGQKRQSTPTPGRQS